MSFVSIEFRKVQIHGIKELAFVNRCFNHGRVVNSISRRQDVIERKVKVQRSNLSNLSGQVTVKNS